MGKLTEAQAALLRHVVEQPLERCWEDLLPAGPLRALRRRGLVVVGCGRSGRGLAAATDAGRAEVQRRAPRWVLRLSDAQVRALAELARATDEKRPALPANVRTETIMRLAERGLLDVSRGDGVLQVQLNEAGREVARLVLGG